MDPNQSLRELRAALDDYRHAASIVAADDAADRLAGSCEALDEWLTAGGFLPIDWASVLRP